MTYYHGKKLSGDYSKNPIVSYRADGSKVIEMIYKDCRQGYNRLDKLIRKPENKRLDESNGFLKVQLPNGTIICSVKSIIKYDYNKVTILSIYNLLHGSTNLLA